MKDKQVNFRVGEEDVARLDALVAHYEMSAAQVVRMLIKRDADALGIVVQAKQAKRGKR